MTQLEIISWNHSGECSLYVWDYFEIFPQKTYHHFGHVTSSWHPKTVLFGHQRNFFQIFAFLTTLTWKLSHKPWWRLFIVLKRLVWNNFFPKNLPYYGPMTSSWHPKTHFWGILRKFFRFSPIWPLKHENYPIKLWWRLFTSLRGSL